MDALTQGSIAQLDAVRAELGLSTPTLDGGLLMAFSDPDKLKAMADEAAVAALRVKAEGGDASAMMRLGFAYRDGERGLKKDATQAFTWIKRAADLKDVDGLTNCGVIYLKGEGVERSQSRGLIMLGAAAALGSEHACGILGYANAEGGLGLDKDPQEAMRWYREVQKCGPRDSNDRLCEKAAAWLRDHP